VIVGARLGVSVAGGEVKVGGGEVNVGGNEVWLGADVWVGSAVSEARVVSVGSGVVGASVWQALTPKRSTVKAS
jgi:hypothetical protein